MITKDKLQSLLNEIEDSLELAMFGPQGKGHYFLIRNKKQYEATMIYGHIASDVSRDSLKTTLTKKIKEVYNDKL